jgi:hypothetical protein
VFNIKILKTKNLQKQVITKRKVSQVFLTKDPTYATCFAKVAEVKESFVGQSKERGPRTENLVFTTDTEDTEEHRVTGFSDQTARPQDCTTARLQDCKTARLHDCTTARLHDCTTARPHDCKTARPISLRSLPKVLLSVQLLAEGIEVVI